MPEVVRSAIGQWRRFCPDGFTVLLAALSGLGVALVMAREITYGVALSPDSIQYIAAVRNLLAGEGYADISGVPLTVWPPLYPLLLAAASLGIWDPLDVAGPVNAAVFGLTIFVVGRYLRQRLASRFLAVWACLAVVLSIPLVELASWTLAGPLFILLATLALVRIDKYLAEGRLSILVWAAVFSALAWQTRYIGVAVPVLVGLLLLFQPGTRLVQRARRIAVFSLVAALPMALWIVRSYLLTGRGVGERRQVDYTLPMLLRQAFDRLWSDWLHLDQPLALWPSLEWLPAVSALLLLAAVLVASIVWESTRVSHGKHVTLLTGAHYVFGGFAVAYFIMLITGLMLGNAGHGVSARYLAPLYIPLLVVVVVTLDRLLHPRSPEEAVGGGSGSPPVAASDAWGRVGIRRPLAAVLMTVLSLWMLGQVPPNVDRIIRANSGDLYIGFSGPRWTDSETLRYVRDNPIDGLVYSTAYRIVYLHNDGTGIYERPPVSRPGGHGAEERHFASGTGQDQFRRWLADVPDGAHVIWFYNWFNSRLHDYGAADMRGAPEFEPVAELADGVIFRIDKSDAPRPNPHLSAYASIVSGDFGTPVVPAARSPFDIRLDGTTLTYLDEICVAEDVAAKFFLHVFPSDEADLSADRRRIGSDFDNLDFNFAQHGAIWDGRCLVVVTLPDYEIARIRTGQYISGEGELWRADFIPSRSPAVTKAPPADSTPTHASSTTPAPETGKIPIPGMSAAHAPMLQSAPDGAIEITTAGPYAVGDVMKATLGHHRPFTNAAWRWSVCHADGSDCKLLPPGPGPAWTHKVGSEERGKLVKVEADFDKELASWTATAVVGVVGTARNEAWKKDGGMLETHFYALQSKVADVGDDAANGGAIEPLGDDLLVVSPWGDIALIDPHGDAVFLDGQVPMNLDATLALPEAQTNAYKFRVADILLKQHSPARWELFVTHHYFSGECFRFRLSSTTILREEGKVTVSPSWRTIFDAEPCLAFRYEGGQNAGGRMVTDGPDHLLIVIGDHAQNAAVQDPDTHLGKLVRVGIETGDAEVLALGLRNPQGLVRDGDGNLWETEHGPHGGEEINLLEPGGNYGWPYVTYGLHYGGEDIPEYDAGYDAGKAGGHDGFVKPVFSWIPSIGISAVVVNDARAFALWMDDLLVASLTGTEEAGLALFRVRRDGTDVQYVERVPVGYRIRDIAQMPDGRIALLGDFGLVHFLSRSYTACDDDSMRKARHIYTLDCGSRTGDEVARAPDSTAAAPVSGKRLYAAHCSNCHSLHAGEHGDGPHLAGVIGRSAGSIGGYPFSNALRSLDLVWTRDNLERFITNPGRFAPGTTMSLPGVTEAEGRAIADFILAEVAPLLPWSGDSRPDAVDAWRRAYRSLLASDGPVARSVFDVYLGGDTVYYVREDCNLEEDTAALFFLHTVPVDMADLPAHRRPNGFESHDFPFASQGGYFDGVCMTGVRLPDYPIARIRAGQFVRGQGEIWKVEVADSSYLLRRNAGPGGS